MNILYFVVLSIYSVAKPARLQRYRSSARPAIELRVYEHLNEHHNEHHNEPGDPDATVWGGGRNGASDGATAPC